MCRLGFVTSEKELDLSRWVMLSTAHYSSSNGDGTGFAVLGKSDIEVTKAPVDAVSFWLSAPNVNLVSSEVIFHVRKKTSGELVIDDTHPFVNEDKSIVLVHNGVLSNYEDSVEALKIRGHVFSSKVDSEVLLHAYEEWGNKMFEELNKLKCSGWVTLLIMKKDGTLIAYTDSKRNLDIYKNKDDNTYFGFSDSTFVTGDIELDVKQDTFYTFKNGLLVSQEDVGALSTYDYASMRGDSFGRTMGSLTNQYDSYEGYSSSEKEYWFKFNPAYCIDISTEVGTMPKYANLRNTLNYFMESKSLKKTKKKTKDKSLGDGYGSVR